MDKQREVAQIVRWEKVAAKQLKNTFSDIEEIQFSNTYNYLAGFVSIEVNITCNKKEYQQVIELPPNKEAYLYSYTPQNGLKEGVANSIVKVLYTNKSKEEI